MIFSNIAFVFIDPVNNYRYLVGDVELPHGKKKYRMSKFSLILEDSNIETSHLKSVGVFEYNEAVSLLFLNEEEFKTKTTKVKK